MLVPDRSARQPLTRADLPAELTPETLRGLSFRTLRQLADHRNGVLDSREQQQFDAALPEVMRATASRINEAVRRTSREGRGPVDPSLRRSYDRTQQRLAEQARRARNSFPELAIDHPAGPGDRSDPAVPPDPTTPDTTTPDTTTPGTTTTAPPHSSTNDSDHDTSPSTLEEEVEQTSDTLDLLEKIASLQQQQLDHQETQLLTETRGVFFAFLVSVAVIIAGVAPLVEAEPHERFLIVIWTVAVTAVAGLVYALVRRIQNTR